MSDLTYPIKVLEETLEGQKWKLAPLNDVTKEHKHKLRLEAEERIPQLEAAIKLLKEKEK